MDRERRELAKACWTLLRGDRRIGQHETDRAWRTLADDEALQAFFCSATSDPDGIREERARVAARWTERHASLLPTRKAGITRLPAVADLLDVWREWGKMVLKAVPVEAGTTISRVESDREGREHDFGQGPKPS